MLEEYAQRNNLTPHIHISDDGYSGTNWQRPGWQELIAKMEAGEPLYCKGWLQQSPNKPRSKPHRRNPNTGKVYMRAPTDVYGCSTHSNAKAKFEKGCTLHNIRTAVIRQLVLETIQAASQFAKSNEAKFIKQVMESSAIRQESAAKSHRKRIAKEQKRIAELNNIIRRIYEDNICGKLTDKRFEALSAEYEQEQETLEKSIAELQAALDSFHADSMRADKLYKEYEKLAKVKGFGAKGKAQKALDTANEYHEEHRPQITLFESSERYLRDVLQKHFDPSKLPSITKWKEERAKLTGETQTLNQQYQKLKSDVDEVSRIRSNVYDIVNTERRREQPHRAMDMER